MGNVLNYKNLKTLHEGNDVLVFQAENLIDHKRYVVKLIKSPRPTQEQLAALMHEYQVNRGLYMQRLVHCQQLIEQADIHLLVFDDVGGVSLKTYLNGRAIGLEQFFPIALEIASCLAELHHNKVIHKDIKPDNLLIDPDDLSVKLFDLSIASQLSVENQEVVAVNKLEGSLPYIAPEQTGRMNRSVDYRSDYYALGITFYEMLTGKLPFVGADPLEYVHFHLAREPKPVSAVNPAIPEMLSRIVAKLMSKQAEDRYQSAEGLKADLEYCFRQWEFHNEISEFTLGEHEAFNNLVISPKIYGRDSEVATLLSTFENVVKGASQCLLISGYSGIGKTRLVNELQKPITSHHGNFISGKFDQLQRSTPYTAFIAAFSKLFKQWLTQSDAELNQRKEMLQRALGDSAQVIIEFFPELELVMGKQPEIEKLQPEQAQNLFLYQFQKFIECVASEEEPLVIFIDDLQWIDQGSLSLLEKILTNRDVKSLLFIGAYRANEVDGLHPFMKLINKLKQEKVVIGDIDLKPLELVHTQEFLADSLKMDGESVHPLAQVLFSKTAGNPFFALEFLKECFSQGILAYDHTKCLWHWDLEKIASMSGSDNVVDLMLQKINKLPENSQKLLQVSSCLGMEFDSSSLSYIETSNELEIIEGLSPALKAGLIQRIDNGLRYKFVHDRIQQAAYQTISDDNKKRLHLAIGRMLLRKAGRHANNEDLFEMLDHFRFSVDYIKSDEKSALAGLAVQAGELAIGSGAYNSAQDYLSFGLRMAENLDFENKYDLLFNLNLDLAQCLYLQGKTEEALDLSNFLLTKANDEIDSALVYKLQIQIYILLNRYEECVRLLSRAMGLLGIKTPVKPSKYRFLYEYIKFRFNFGRGSEFVKRILKCKQTEDKKAILLSEFNILSTIPLIASSSYANFFLVMVMKYADYASKYPVTSNIIFDVMAAVSLIYILISSDNKEFRTINEAAFEFYKNVRLLPQLTQNGNYLVILLYTSSSHMKVREVCSFGEQAILKEEISGNFTFLTPTVTDYLLMNNNADTHLSEINTKARLYIKLGERLHITPVIKGCEFISLSCQYLMGNDELPLDQIIDLTPKANTGLGLLALQNLYFSEDYTRAKKLSSSLRRHTFLIYGEQAFVNGLSILIFAQQYQQSSPKEREQAVKLINKLLSRIKKHSDAYQNNFLHLYLIGQAELARIHNETLKALELYRQAIEQSKNEDFIRWAAIANERAGELYLELGDTTAASAYIQEAIYYFRLWGCMLKVNILKTKYASLLEGKLHISAPVDSKSATTSTLVTGDLDLSAMLKANQAISSEIKLDKLLPSILHVVLEAAGADKASFIGLSKNRWVIESQAEYKDNQYTTNNIAEPLTPESDLPEGLISYTIRTGTTEVIGDLTMDKEYAGLPYVTKHNPKSVFCLPILREGKVVAALYLENNQIAHAFTQDRVQLLQSLSTQIAISLENARYFEHTQEIFRSTERFVPKKFIQLLGRKNIEEVKKGDNVKIEMSAIFADLRDFTTLSESIEPEELTYMLNTYLKYMSPIIRDNNGFVNRVLGDGILALFPNEPQDAVQASVEMLQTLPLLNKELNEAGFQSLLMGIGVNTGPAMLCALGEEERIEANVVSDMVNAASRIEGLNKIYGTNLLISDLTYSKLKNLSKFSIRMVDNVRVKGKTKALGLYEVLPVTLREDDEQYFAEFERAFKLYTKGNFKIARLGFEKCLKLRHDDSVAQLYIERCECFASNLPENWDGVTTMLEK